MLGKLKDSEIEHLLKEQAIGRIGCHSDGVTYVVPVNYFYDGEYIYSYSAKGMKIDMMRKNPEVCFEIDKIKDIVNWQSVIVWGRFEEITKMDEQQKFMPKMISRIMFLINNNNASPSHGITENEYDVGNSVELIVYRIVLTKKTGRYEKRENKDVSKT